MTLKEKFAVLKKAAQADARAVRNRYTVCGGYREAGVNPNCTQLKQEVETAALLGHETHLRISNGKLTIYHVKNMPPVTFDVEYA